MISSLSSGSANIFFKNAIIAAAHAMKRTAAHRTWLLTDAEASSLRKKHQSSLAEEAPESDQCLIESLLHADYDHDVLYGLSRNNGDIASDLRVTHHAHIDERREALSCDPRELVRYESKFEYRIQFMMSALVRQRGQRIAPLYTACLSIVAHRKSLCHGGTVKLYHQSY